jgi:hypothetical protein
MDEFHGLTGGQVNLLDPVTCGNFSKFFQLVGLDHATRHTEPDDAEIRVTLGYDTSTGIEVMVDLSALTWHSNSFLFCKWIVVVKVLIIIQFLYQPYIMNQSSEYMEAFFGVELNQKFADMINELMDVEESLKDLSRNIAQLGTDLAPDEKRGLIKELKAIAYENAQQTKDVRNFLDFYLKSDKESTQIILERDAYMKIYQIFKWEGSDVRDLKRWIKELRELCDKIGLNVRDLINFKKLTAQPVPDEIVKFPVYAYDKQGYCLTGPEFDIVMHIDEVREEMEEESKE